MQKRGKDRGKTPWLIGSPWLIIVVLMIWGSATWFANREPSPVNLDLGALKEILPDKSLSFQKVSLGRGEIYGYILTHDVISDGDKNGEASLTVPFRTRHHLENDPTLVPLLDKHGIAYRVEEEESLVNLVLSILASLRK